MRCDTCGAAEGACAHEPAPASGLELDFDRGRPAPKVAAPAAVMGPVAPPERVYAAAPIHQSGGLVSDAVVKLAIIGGVVVAVTVAIWFGVQRLRANVESAMDEAATRPYPAPNRLVIANVTSDYGANALTDGSVVLEKSGGPSLGFAAWYGTNAMPPAGFLDEGTARHTYRALAAPTEPCRSDVDSSVATLGEVDGEITLSTCSVTKRGNAYFLAWAMRMRDVDANARRVTSMMKGAQLVSDRLCSLDVINGGCQPSAAALVSKLIENAKK